MKKLQTSSKPRLKWKLSRARPMSQKKSDMLGVILAIDKPCEKIILK